MSGSADLKMSDGNSAEGIYINALIKFYQYIKVNLATLAFHATLAQTKRDVKQVEQVYTVVYTSAKFPNGRSISMHHVQSCSVKQMLSFTLS